MQRPSERYLHNINITLHRHQPFPCVIHLRVAFSMSKPKTPMIIHISSKVNAFKIWSYTHTKLSNSTNHGTMFKWSI